MKLTRRQALQAVAAAASLGVVNTGLAADPPVTNGKSAQSRMPLDKFLKDARLVKALRSGIQAMKDRPPYDPFSWFYQAAIHGVPPEMVNAEEARMDAISQAEGDKFRAVFQKRYWNQCPHNGEEAANFLPWHRAYTHYFEKILRLHTKEPDFALPYWDYEPKANRKFPKEFGEPFINGDSTQPNPLFMQERDFYFTRYDHPFAVGLPLLELTDEAVDSSHTLSTNVFFGDSETEGLGGGYADEDGATRGMLESRPHDHIHRAVGGIIPQAAGAPALGAMATPPTAGFDPIFPFHHANIDRLWAVWSCMSGKSWGMLPPNYWFNERAWYFWDVGPGDKPLVVNEPRKNFFDYRSLGISFEGIDPSCKPLSLPPLDEEDQVELVSRRRQLEVIAEHRMTIRLSPAARSIIQLDADVRTKIAPSLRILRAARAEGAANASDGRLPRAFLRLINSELGFVPATGFDIHLTTGAPDAPLRRSDKSFVGSISLFRHQASRSSLARSGSDDHHEAAGNHAAHASAEMFDISTLVSEVDEGDLGNLRIVAVPYSLLTAPGKDTVFVSGQEFSAGGIQFMLSR